jgi:hypothetical protein
MQQLDPSIIAHLCDSLAMVERSVIYDKHRVRLRVRPAVMEKLLFKVFKHSTVSRALEDWGPKDSFLCVRRQYLVSVVPVQTGDLHRCYSERGPARASEANALIAPEFVDVY